MAKKQPIKPSQPKEPQLKLSIRKFLTDGSMLKETINDPNLDFGFRFLFPKGKDASGKDVGRNFTVTKVKDVLAISQGTQLDDIHAKGFDALDSDKKNKFLSEITKIIFVKELLFNVNFSPERKIFAVIDEIFIEDDKISKDAFFRSIRKIYGTVMYIIAFINEFLGKPSIDGVPLGPTFYS